jgi:PAS domain S-box-containing protein
VLLATAALIALALGQRLVGGIARLTAAAAEVAASATPRYELSGISEIDEVGRALESAVRERDRTQETFRLAQEVGGIGAWEWDLVSDLGFVSASYREMHGLTEAPRLLRLSDVIATIHPEDRRDYTERLALARETVAASTSEYRVVRPDGSVRWLYAKGRSIIDRDGTARRALGVVVDITDRRESEDRLRLLMREVDHRANNLLAVVQGTVSLSRAHDAEVLREVILGRIEALARAHQLLAASRWSGADLQTLVREEVAPFLHGDPDRVTIDGPTLPIEPSAAQALAMALHELTTNAAKHGALSATTGSVDIRWTVTHGVLRLVWTESGGPAVRPPKERGFGTTLLQRALAGSLRGRTELEWRRDGLVCSVTMPIGTDSLFGGRNTEEGLMASLSD